MSTPRTHFTFRVDTWTPDCESIVDHVGGGRTIEVARVKITEAGRRVLAKASLCRKQGCGTLSRPDELTGPAE